MSQTADHPKTIRNEQLKLAATLFNNIAVAIIVTGFVVPIISLLEYQSGLHRRPYWIAYVLLSLASAALNHQIARRLLGRMAP